MRGNLSCITDFAGHIACASLVVFVSLFRDHIVDLRKNVPFGSISAWLLSTMCKNDGLRHPFYSDVS